MFVFLVAFAAKVEFCSSDLRRGVRGVVVVDETVSHFHSGFLYVCRDIIGTPFLFESVDRG